MSQLKLIHSVEELSLVVNQLKKEGKTIALVPTMGALHAGHLSLVRKATQETDYCIVSIFVNPTQFNNSKDLEKYPRNLERDLLLLQTNTSCQFVFAPSITEIYDDRELQNTFDFDFGGLDVVMEGKFRPGHFNGVVQIVSKLFELSRPDKAYFGEKDFQQLAIIKRMVKVLGFDIEIVDCPILRESNGLAMSSRNERLSEQERDLATNIYKVLCDSLWLKSTNTPAQIEKFVADQLNNIAGLELEYFEIVDAEMLQSLKNWTRPAVGCIAVYCGDVRLIDNIRY